MVGFHGHPGGDQPERESIDQGRQDLETVKAERAFRRRPLSGELHGDQRQGDGGRIGQHVSRVGKQRQTAGQDAADDLGEHVTENQDESGK